MSTTDRDYERTIFWVCAVTLFVIGALLTLVQLSGILSLVRWFVVVSFVLSGLFLGTFLYWGRDRARR